MTRAEYMEGLAKALKDYDEDFALDIIGDYRRHFDEAAADGRSEESVCEELGSVEDFIRDIPEEFKRNSEPDEKEQDDAEFSEKAGEEAHSTGKNDDITDDFEKLASDIGKFVNEAGKMAGKAGAAAGKAAIKAAKSADSAISKLSEVISDKINEAMEDKTSDIFDSDEGSDDEGGKAVKDIADGMNLDKDDIFEEKTDDNTLIVCSYNGIRGIKMSVVEPHVELTQSDTDAVTITLSRPLTKKEKMYMSPVVTVEDGILKVKQENKSRAFAFLNNIGNAPLIYYVNIPAKFEKINISTVSGGIIIQSQIVTDGCKLSTVSGSIKTEYEIQADKIKLNTVSGSIKTGMLLYAKKQELSSVSGSIKAVAGQDSFSLDTVSGSVKLAIAAPCSGNINTVSGSIVINLLADIGIDIKSSGMSGSMKLMTDKHVDWNNGENEKNVHFGFSKSDRHAIFGDGLARVTTGSVSGSVKVYDFGKME